MDVVVVKDMMFSHPLSGSQVATAHLASAKTSALFRRSRVLAKKLQWTNCKCIADPLGLAEGMAMRDYTLVHRKMQLFITIPALTMGSFFHLLIRRAAGRMISP